MASKRRLRRKSCAAKHRYPTLDAALRDARDIGRKQGGRLNAYGCHFCGGFHVGHTPARVARIVDARATR
jgi:hypothetical protein